MSHIGKADTRIQINPISDGNYAALPPQTWGLRLTPYVNSCLIAGISFVLGSRSSPTKWGKVSSLSGVGIYGSDVCTVAILVLVMEGSSVQLLHLFKLVCDSLTAW